MIIVLVNNIEIGESGNMGKCTQKPREKVGKLFKQRETDLQMLVEKAVINVLRLLMRLQRGYSNLDNIKILLLIKILLNNT